MDPWYYNRLSNASASFQSGSGANASEYHQQLAAGHQSGGNTGATAASTSQLLLQAAHNTSLTPSPFNTPGFLTSSPYDFPLFHTSKNSPYAAVSQHRALASAMASSKSSESELSSLRENYSAAHHPSLSSTSSSYFDHQSPTPSTIGWSHQTGAQLPSPFGILPHESVGTQSTGSSKPASSDYNFNAYQATHNISHLSQLAEFKNSSAYADAKSAYADSKGSTSYSEAKNSSSYADAKKGSRPQSPASSSKTPVTSSATASFYSGSMAAGIPSNYGSSESSARSGYSTSSKFASTNPVHQQQASCIVTSPSVTPSSKDYRMHQSSARAASSSIFQDTTVGRDKQASSRSANFVPLSTKSSQPQNAVQTKAQSKIYPDLATSTESSRRSTTPHDTSQSSPISLSTDPVAPLRYPSVHSEASSQSKQAQHVTVNQAQSYQQSLNQQAAAYRLYANSSGMTESEYLRSKSSAVDSSYNSSSQQNGSECVSAPRRTSPHVSHSQQSPSGHVPSPAYPMYNSPMASMSSPSPLQHSESPCQQNSGNSFKATSSTTPLDVSMGRSQVGQSSVAYPSVITRALTAPEPVAKPSVYNDTRSYDRSQEATPYSKPCWDSSSERQSSANAMAEQGSSSSHQRKYQSASNSIQSYAANSSVPHQQADPRPSERQHPFYDSTAARQVTLQDLSSCRDDPMSIVKNLQNLQQQTCHVQSTGDDSRSGSKTSSVDSTSSNKRRKSADKQASSADYYHTNRIPPPAHHNIPAQQHQNGSYFSNYLSPPSSSRSYTGSQTPMHHASNSFMANQHQGLYVPPFFSPFSLPGHSTASAASSSQSTAANYQTPTHLQTQFPDCSTQSASNTQTVTQTQEHQLVEEASKVLVPNVEEELSFLIGPVLMIKTEKERKSMTSSGFQDSYLKFLQGERDTSPPPSQRGVRKTTWTKNVKIYQPEPPKPETATDSVTNGGAVVTAATPSTHVTATKDKAPAYDPEDDPRYFPLPKTDAQRRSFDTSDSDSDNDTTNVKTPKQQSSKAQDRKPVAAVAPRTASKQTAKVSPVTSQPGKRGRKRKSEVASVPRRETSKRKAKEKGSILLNDGDDDFPEGCGDGGDSDSDPAWTPVAFKPKSQNMDSSDEENVKKRCPKKVPKLSGSSRKRSKNPISDSDDEAPSGDEKPKKRGSVAGPRGRRKSLNMLQGSSVKSGENAAPDGDEAEMFPFKVGEFVVMRTDMSEKWPPIWRVDGKTLLQKFEPFVKNGEMLYRNISTYSGWSPLNRHIYRSAQVRFRVNSKTETVVEFLRDEMTEEDESVLETFVKETAQYQDNFEVYIQTLISQALDSNFLTEIFQEQDEYFLSNVKTVDEIVDNRRKRFLQVVNWRSELEASIATWPCYNVMFELVGDEFQKNCAACDRPSVAARVLLYGQPYNSTTLEGSQPDPKLESEKDFYTCRLCLSRIELYNKVAHQKYLMYIECAKRVNEKRSADSSKDSTVILNELLADEKWLNLLFRNVRLSWAQIDRLEQSGQKK